MPNVLPYLEIRLNIDRMRDQIVAAIALREEQFAPAVDEAITKALADFDFEREIQNMAEQILSNILKSAVHSALYEAMQSPDVKLAMQNVIGDYLKRVLSSEL